jgi:hypothetical protein
VCRLLVATGLALIPFRALGQTAPAILLPPGITVPNFDRVFPGLSDAIEAGAELARSHDPAAVWYNPAGIVLTDRTIINASALGYQLTLITSSGLFSNVNNLNLLTIPGFIGVILGREVIPWEKVRLGFAIANPISWNQGLSLAGNPAPGSFITYSANSNIQSYQPTAAVAYEVSPKLRLGLSLGFTYDTLGDSGEIASQTTASTNAPGSITTLSLGGYAFQFISSLGVQYEALPWLNLGAVVRSPSARIFGNAWLDYESLITTMQGTQQVHFKSTSGDYEFVHPLEVDLGAALKSRRGAELEVDLRWHMASGTYALTTFPAQKASVVTTPIGGPPSTVTAQFPDLRFGTRMLFNAGIGGRVRLSRLFTFNGGLYVDQTPIAPGVRIFQAINLYGARAGVAVTTETLSGSMGLGYETGLSGSQPSPGDPTRLASLRVQTLTLLLSIAYKF